MDYQKKPSINFPTLKNSVFIQFFLRHKFQILFLSILISYIFLRFCFLFQRANLGWDQIDSAWAANNILVNKHFLINGPVAKGNSGIYMGPLYYYGITIVYFFTHMDPIASPIFQAVMSIISFFVLYFVTKKIFDSNVALIAAFISTFSLITLNADRVQSAFYLIVPVSYLIFYALYKIVTGKEKYILCLAVFLGLSFHVDFTSIFYPILIFLALPFFPRTKRMLTYSLLALPLFVVFIFPLLLSIFSIKHSTSSSFLYLLHNSYHGFHLRRLLQIAHDGFISFEQVLQFSFLKPFVYFLFPIFAVVYYISHPKNKRQSLLLLYLMGIWILVPWIVLSTYSGELTDYYFSPTRYLAIAMLAYLTVSLLQRKNIVFKILPIIFWIFYGWYSLQIFFSEPSGTGNLLGIEASAKQAILEKKVIPFKDKDPLYFVYYEYTRQNKEK